MTGTRRLDGAVLHLIARQRCCRRGVQPLGELFVREADHSHVDRFREQGHEPLAMLHITARDRTPVQGAVGRGLAIRGLAAPLGIVRAGSGAFVARGRNARLGDKLQQEPGERREGRLPSFAESRLARLAQLALGGLQQLAGGQHDGGGRIAEEKVPDQAGIGRVAVMPRPRSDAARAMTD